MEAPARTARRLFFGIGVALLLATSFALIDGRLPPAECEMNEYNCTSTNELGWMVPLLSGITLFFGLMLHLGIEKGVKSPLLALFPVENSKEQRELISMDLSDSQDEDSLSNAWAELEQGLLSSKEEE